MVLGFGMGGVGGTSKSRFWHPFEPQPVELSYSYCVATVGAFSLSKELADE